MVNVPLFNNSTKSILPSPSKSPRAEPIAFPALVVAILTGDLNITLLLPPVKVTKNGLGL